MVLVEQKYCSPYGTSPKRTLHQVYELLLIEMESAYSYSASLPRNARYTILWVAVDRNRICIFLLWVAFPKCALHQVYELLLIEIELIHRNLIIPNKESYSQI